MSINIKIEKHQFTNLITDKQLALFVKHDGLASIKKVFHLVSCPSTEEEARELLTKKQFDFLSDYVTNMQKYYDEGFSIILDTPSAEGGTGRDAFLTILGKYLYLTGASYCYRDVADLLILAKSFKEEDTIELEYYLNKQFLFIEVSDLAFSDKRDFETFRTIIRKRFDASLPIIFVSPTSFFADITWPPSLLTFFARSIASQNHIISFEGK